METGRTSLEKINRAEPLPEIGAFDDRLPYAYGGLERWPGKDRKGLSSTRRRFSR